jgi:hypothetical protein
MWPPFNKTQDDNISDCSMISSRFWNSILQFETNESWSCNHYISCRGNVTTYIPPTRSWQNNDYISRRDNIISVDWAIAAEPQLLWQRNGILWFQLAKSCQYTNISVHKITTTPYDRWVLTVVFCDMTTHSLENRCQHLRGTCYIHLLKMEAGGSSENVGTIYQTTWHHISQLKHGGVPIYICNGRNSKEITHSIFLNQWH